MQIVLGERLTESQRNSVLKPRFLSHGTCEIKNMAATRRFYEEFLGLDCVQISGGALIFALGLKFHVVCIETGPGHTKRLNLLNHWGLEVDTYFEVAEAHRRAHEMKDEYGIAAIMPIERMGGRTSFYMEDLDGNFWEIQYYGGLMHDDFFDFGDVTNK